MHLNTHFNHFNPPHWVALQCEVSEATPAVAVASEASKVTCIPYSRKIWQGIKFGGLADELAYRQIKFRQIGIVPLRTDLLRCRRLVDTTAALPRLVSTFSCRCDALAHSLLLTAP